MEIDTMHHSTAILTHNKITDKDDMADQNKDSFFGTGEGGKPFAQSVSSC